ncbi:hypothetical protein QL285_079072 [Trifolium repens]|nr:hypothetical protein QL285_079072 [Trifolium repens]
MASPSIVLNLSQIMFEPAIVKQATTVITNTPTPSHCARVIIETHVHVTLQILGAATVLLFAQAAAVAACLRYYALLPIRPKNAPLHYQLVLHSF